MEKNFLPVEKVLSLIRQNGAFFAVERLIFHFYLRKIYMITISFSFIYGGLFEVLQFKYFNRGGDWWDLFADVLGGVVGCLLYPTAKKQKDKFVDYLYKKLKTRKV